MPISRYEIRNEYSLADPELYQAADKDDPEALLEGVAMAGLVGVLRQLGDLAEFAAEIFHDLHEEVMATAARGHSLMIRVQQLEAEVPSIEKAFLSQTDHSSFFYNAGVDWHPNSRITQNLVTQGDLPRFVMDSYEECRGPPRLFLLDKFDVAGAGACLKRYTDPSFFKVETSAMANADVRREKKSRKAKKKGPRGVYGETPECLPASHAKLHRLFLEEPDENSVKRRAHRAKLKRRLNGFPFDSKTGKSYMERLLKSPSPEHKEITASSPLFMLTDDHNEADLDVIELKPARESEGRKIKFPPAIREDIVLTPLVNHTDDKSVDISVVTDDIPSTFNEENDEKDITVYGESKREGSLTGYQSDEVPSEIDNYMDAPSTIESEIDTDSELRVKNDSTTSYIKSQPSVSVESEEHLPRQLSEETQCSHNVSSSKSLSGNDSPRFSSGEHLVDGEDAQNSDGPSAISAHLLPEDDNDLADHNDLVDMTSNLNMSNVLSQNRVDTEVIITNESTTLGELDDEVSKFPENFASDFTDIADSGEDITSKVPEGEKQNEDLYIQESTIVSDAPIYMGISVGKEFTETSFTNTENDSEEHYSNNLIVKQISSETLVVLGGLDAHHRDFIPDEGMTDVTPSDLVDLKSSFCMPENLEEPLVTSDSDAELECSQFNSPSDLELRSEVHVLLDESESKTYQLETAFSDNNNRGDAKLVEEHISCFEDSRLGEYNADKTSLPGSNMESELVEEKQNYHGRSDLVEEVDEREAASLDYDHTKSEVPNTVFSSNLDSEIEQTVGFLDTAQIRSPLEQSGLVTGHDSFLKNGIENPLSVAEETVLQEKIELPSNEIDQESPESGEIKTELTSLSPIDHQKTLDHDNNEEHNNFASSFSLVKDQLGIRFPPSTPFSETNQIDLDELPPLPPLPPLQWRIGMLQHASPNIDLKKTEHEEVFPQEIYPPAASTGNLSSSLKPTNHSPVPIILQSSPSLEVNSVHEEKIDFPPMLEQEQQLVMATQMSDEVASSALPCDEIIPVISLQEKNFEQSSPSLEATSMHGEEIDLPPTTENEQQQLVMPAQMSDEVASSVILACDEIIPVISLQEMNVDQSSPSLEATSMHETTVLPPKMQNEEQQLETTTQKSDELASSALQVYDEILPQTSLKEENVEESTPLFRDNSMNETTVLPPKIENVEQQQLVMPTQKSDELASSSSLLVCDEISSKTSLKEENVVERSPSFRGNSMHATTDFPPKVEKEQQLVMPSPKSDDVASSADEDGVANGSRTMRLPWSCNPVIGSAAALDKSKLRKVTARDRPQMQKPDERDSLLEQIRAKSFNLKPAVTSRPSTRGPNTNLKVAAILEKANAIRQALAGSDEDDEDNWSDS